MKRIVLILMMIVPMIGISQTTVADGGTENIDIPFDAYYKYSYTESIYYPSEIGSSGWITELCFEYNGCVGFTEDIVLYLGHTSKNVFGFDDFITSNLMTKVYDGTITVSGNGVDTWYCLTLDSPFFYNGTDNLVLGADANTPAYYSSCASFLSKQTRPGGVSQYRSTYYYSDSYNPDPSNPPYGGRFYYVPSLKLTIGAVITPIELKDFSGIPYNNDNLLKWTVSSEFNNDYFTVSYSIDGERWYILEDNIKGLGNSQTETTYSILHGNVNSDVIYYKLKQTDYNGDSEEFNIIKVVNSNDVVLLKPIHNVIGQEVDEHYKGVVIYRYSDGTIERVTQ